LEFVFGLLCGVLLFISLELDQIPMHSFLYQKIIWIDGLWVIGGISGR
jgi:hypothetical protein